MNKNKRKMLVTSALTYANDSVHLGHMLEYVQTDVWVRFQRLRGNECYFIGGSDCHGTPVMLRSEKLGVKPEELVAKVHAEQEQDCRDFLISLDNYYTTHSKENCELATLIYERLNARGDIVKKEVAQFFDPEKNMFLPDRFVKGECPRCGAKDQYGDNCEVCGAIYEPAELIDPKSVLSGAKPLTKTSEHYFFQLPRYEKVLKEWIHAGHLQEQVANKLDEWFEHGLRDWDISRDAPYFGFEIPAAPGKYFYVWMDAPIGYISGFKNLCEQLKLDFASFWEKDSTTELYHFLGKDIIYFHALFWPAMLMGADFRTPTAIFTHGFLTINGEKMSKSRGNFIKARQYLNQLEPEYLRYYFAAKLSHRIEDIDLNFEDFRLRVNADLVGKVINIASRCAGFITKRFDGILSAECSEPNLLNELQEAAEVIADCYEKREFSHAVRKIMELADRVNQYIDEKKPWVLAKEEGKEAEVQQVCSVGLNCFRLLMLYLKPILPSLAQNTETFLNIPALKWEDHRSLLLKHKINKFKPLMQRVEAEKVAGICI
jgi:methionyl-tRNA synthetase